MPIDRPERTSKIKAKERVARQQLSDDEELDYDDSIDGNRRRTSRTRTRKSLRLDDDSEHSSEQPDLDSEKHETSDSPSNTVYIHQKENQPKLMTRASDLENKNSPYNDEFIETKQEDDEIIDKEDQDEPIGQPDDDDDDDDSEDFVNINRKSQSQRSIPIRLPIAVPKEEQPITRKSRRVSKPPDILSPDLPAPRSRSVRNSSTDRMLSREERYRRRKRMSEGNDDSPDGENHGTRKSTRRAAKRLKHYHELSDDERIEDEVIMKDDTGTPSDGMPEGSKHPYEFENMQSSRRRRSRRSSIQNDPQSKEMLQQQDSIDGVAAKRPVRRSRAKTKYIDGQSDGEDDGDGDGDYHVSASDAESDEPEDPSLMEQEDLEIGHAEGLADSPIERKRSTRGKKSRKSAKKSTPSKRTRPRRAVTREANTLATEAVRSYRPLRESVRKSDFYKDRSDDSSSSGSGSAPQLRTSTRAAARKANDAVRAEMDKVDFLKNPMALFGMDKPSKSKRSVHSRYKGRIQPARPNPLASDDDDGLGPGAQVGPIEPIQIDLDLSWDDIGGLDHHVRALKEMVFLPLMYPEIFEKFNMEAPKGVLFYGPPGTGKTLCAKALAASCGGGKRRSTPVVNSTPNGKDPAMKDNSDENSNALPKASTDNELIADSDKNNLNKQELSKDPYPEQNEPMTDIPKPTEVDLPNNATLPPTENGEIATTNEQSIVTGNEINPTPVHTTQVGNTAKPAGSEHKAPNTIDEEKPTQRVAFFMRNGADCLSKWVGEAERQLRMTFEAAKKHQPSIIFFDEIDGLAPVRSSRQDQIHSSIVSTLLALMDGLDARGRIIVIGATNRVDAIDPALRRPGRFDRELIFTLPNMKARRRILDINTSKWKPSPKATVLDAVAKATVGYCGADLKSLCSESAIRALRRRYPQIYDSNDKLLINVDEVKVSTKDFLAAMREIVPASHRSARTFARPLIDRLAPLLNEALNECKATIRRIFSTGISSEYNGLRPAPLKQNGADDGGKKNDPVLDYDSMLSSSEDDDDISVAKIHSEVSNAGSLRTSARSSQLYRSQILRPRLLICGVQGLGQAQLGPALLHFCEGCPVHAIDYPSLFADAGAKCAEEALTTAFREAARSVPSILYLPHLQLWWKSAPESLQTTLIIALKDLPSDLPLFVLATAESSLNMLPPEITELFVDVHELSPPGEPARQKMFDPLIKAALSVPKQTDHEVSEKRKKRAHEVLPIAPLPPPKPPTAEEKVKKIHNEDRYIRLLRMEMRAFTERLLRDSRFRAFWNPVDPNSAPDYYEIIKVPMDISQVAAQIDRGQYPTVLAMVNDFDIMVKNAIQYNPPNTETGAAILRRAHGLIDIVHAWVDNLNPTLVATCNKIVADRITRAKRQTEEEESKKVKEAAECEKLTSCVEKTGEVEDLTMKVLDVTENHSKLNTSKPSVTSSGQGVDLMNVHYVTNNEPSPAKKAFLGKSTLLERGHILNVEGTKVPSKMQVEAFVRLILDVTHGVSLEGLEGLYVKCEKVILQNRLNKNRNEVLNALSNVVYSARDDPALVGKLVE